MTFAFNGGPGSSSVWLHLGLFGPRRVLMGDVGALARRRTGSTDNLETLLAVSDLVFIDPVTTGYSRASEGHKADDFHGYTRDVESVGEFIRLWTSRQRPLAVAEVPGRRVLRHHPRPPRSPRTWPRAAACTSTA